MKKLVLIAGMASVLSLGIASVSFAGEWKQDSKGWWYQNDDGSYYNDGWHWIDGNNDGTSESYYFTNDGYVLTNTKTPDGYTVNEDGAWVENGTVKTKETFWTKMYGIRIKYNPAFSNISRQIYKSVWFTDQVDYYSFGANGQGDTCIRMQSASRVNKSDAEERKRLYDQLKEDNNKIIEYDANGSHWMAFENSETLSNGVTHYEVLACAFTAKNEYAIYYEDVRKEHLSVEEFLDQIVISDDRSENWLNAEKSSMQQMFDKDGHPGWNFRLKQQ